jgi:hypothetical protein
MIPRVRADEWAATGLRRDEVADAIGLGLSVAEVRAWAPFRPLEIHWARRHRLSLAGARRWAAAGVPVRDAVRAEAVGLTLAELRDWEARGFNASDAWEAKETGLGIEAAAAWREAGFVLPDALQLVRDRWNLDAAVAARGAGPPATPGGRPSEPSSSPTALTPTRCPYTPAARKCWPEERWRPQ